MTIWEDTDIAINIDPLQKQMLDDVFDDFTMLSNGGFVSLMHVDGGFTRYSAGGGMISSVGTEVSASTVYACMNYAYEESRRHKHGDLVDFNGSVNYDGTEALELINTIRESAAEGCRGFELEYLPVIDAQTDRIKGAEAIIYWQDARHGRVASEAFMPILERDFIFKELGDFMLERGLSDGVRLLECDPDFLLCLDVYRIQLESGYFIDTLQHYLRATGFPPPQLSLKFDNGCRFIGMERLKSIIQALHARGIPDSLSLDALIGKYDQGGAES
ncbi:MAG: EAL domain-containing protein [Clostridia bacterium]|nr:EAL domain-containing protein [Clostridia bacterium]